MTYVELKKIFEEKLNRQLTVEEEQFIRWMSKQHDSIVEAKPILTEYTRMKHNTMKM